MADILRETSLNESQREITETLSNSAQLLLAQIEGVLDMAKIEAGRVQLESEVTLPGALTATTAIPRHSPPVASSPTGLPTSRSSAPQGEAAVREELRQELLRIRQLLGLDR